VSIVEVAAAGNINDPVVLRLATTIIDFILEFISVLGELLPRKRQ